MSKKKRRKPAPRAQPRTARSGAQSPRTSRPSRAAAAVDPPAEAAPPAATPSASARRPRAGSKPDVEVAPPPPVAAQNRAWVVGISALTLVAAVLRLVALSRVPDSPFYDAAVRSMAGSWHDFFFGAFDPGGSASVGKPPVDLWAQVLAVKLVGFNSTGLRLPGALASSAAVPVLYDLVRRLAGRTAGIASAVTLAVLPVAVITARSDTTDSLMMALLVAAAWLVVRYAERRELRWLVLAAVVLGVDFNVKLLEALIPLPAFVVFLWMSARGDGVEHPRVRRLAAAGAVFVAVAVCWVVAVSLTPHADRPYPIGSTDGSIWNAVFVHPGTSRLAPATVSDLARAAATASSASAGPLRLLHRAAGDFGGLLGTTLFAGLVLGVLALLGSSTRLVRPPPDAPRDERLRRAAVVGLGVWVLTGVIVVSCSSRVGPRDVEAFTPALAVMLGLSVTVVAGRVRDLTSAYLLAGGLGLGLLESLAVVGSDSLARVGLGVGLVLALAGCVLVAREMRLTPPPPAAAAVARKGSPSDPPTGRRFSRPGTIVVFSMVALLAFPVARDVELIRDHSGVQPTSAELSPRLGEALSGYLRAHQGGAEYEFAATTPGVAAPVIVKDRRPVLLLTTVDARPLVTLAGLRAAIAGRAVSYVVVDGACPVPPDHLLAACSAAAAWVRANGQDVTAALGDPQTTSGVLFRVG